MHKDGCRTHDTLTWANEVKTCRKPRACEWWRLDLVKLLAEGGSGLVMLSPDLLLNFELPTTARDSD